MSLTIDEFTMVPESQFGLTQIRMHPVWARYYEPDDIEAACSWGIHREVFLNLLDEFHHGNDHAFFPVLEFNPLPDEELDIYLRASLTTADGTKLEGYISADAGFLHVYIDDEMGFSFTAKTVLDDLRDKELKILEEHMPGLTLLPLQYSTPYKLSDGSSINGTFS